jgi:hypothetical protein
MPDCPHNKQAAIHTRNSSWPSNHAVTPFLDCGKGGPARAASGPLLPARTALPFYLPLYCEDIYAAPDFPWLKFYSGDSKVSLI